MFDWEVESPGMSVRLHQSLGPDDMIPTSVKLRNHSLSAFGADPTVASMPRAVDSTAGPSSAGLEQRIVQATSGPDPWPPIAHRHTFPTVRIDKNIMPTVPPDDVLSSHTKSSVQKILKLTGNMNPATSLATDTPSLHKSTQKIRQLTGLDCGPRRGSEIQLQTLQEEASIASSETSSSLCSQYGLEDISYEPANSTYSHSHVEGMAELNTALTVAPRYSGIMSPRDHSSRMPVKKALRLSGFIAADIGVTMPEQGTPSAARRDSWYEHNSEEESHDSSSSEVYESEYEMEPTAAELYHDSAMAISKASRASASSGGGGVDQSLSRKPRNGGSERKHQSSDILSTPRSQGSTQGSTSISSTFDSILSPSPSTSRPFPLNPFRKRQPLRERRGHAPSSLDSGAASSSQSAKGKPQPFRTPYPPVSSSIRASVDEAEDGQARLSLLARIFTNGSGSGSFASLGGSGGGGGKRDSTASGGSGQTTTTTRSTWSPDTPSPGTVTFGAAAAAARHSMGLLARTMDSARHAAGRMSKADKAASRRGSLKAKIRVLRGDGGSPAA